MALPDIFRYSDFRLFLADYYRARKFEDPKFSHRFIQDKVRAGSAGWFADICAGRINLSSGHAAGLLKMMKLDPRQEDYFEALVGMAQAGTMEEKNRWMRRILSFKEIRSDVVGAEKFEFYSHWHYSAVREALFFVDFTGDFQALAQRFHPPLKKEQVKAAIALLQRLEMVRKDAHGRLRPVATTIKKDPAFKSLHAANFLKAGMDLAIQALDNLDKDSRDMSSLTLALSAEGFAEARAEVKALRKKLLALAERETRPDKVYQCNFQMFPLMK
jgi:uncharacterized protein (TIGR02147 family)